MSSSIRITLAARDSKLSKAQVEEVLAELRQCCPEAEFDMRWVKTLGDKDLTTSLRTLGKTDFFTQEIDRLLLDKECRIAVHSAKDLPEPLPKGLTVVAMTKGLDPADVLVLREGKDLASLPSGALIGTSCERRDQMIKKLRSDLQCIDVRGTVDRRLFLLDSGIIDGLVAAEAGLLRLGQAHRVRIRLEGEIAPLQGRLAVVAREDDLEMAQLFRCLHHG